MDEIYHFMRNIRLIADFHKFNYEQPVKNKFLKLEK